MRSGEIEGEGEVSALKKCTECHKKLSIKEFWKSSSGGLRAKCKRCTKSKYDPYSKRPRRETVAVVNARFRSVFSRAFKKRNERLHDVARKLGITKAAIIYILTGKRGVSLAYAVLLAKEFKINLEKLK